MTEDSMAPTGLLHKVGNGDFPRDGQDAPWMPASADVEGPIDASRHVPP